MPWLRPHRFLVYGSTWSEVSRCELMVPPSIIFKEKTWPFLSNHQPIYPSLPPFMSHLLIHSPTHTSVHSSIYLQTHSPIHPPTNLCIHPPASPPNPSIPSLLHLSVHLSASFLPIDPTHPPHPPIHLSIHPSPTHHPFVHLSNILPSI